MVGIERLDLVHEAAQAVVLVAGGLRRPCIYSAAIVPWELDAEVPKLQSHIEASAAQP